MTLADPLCALPAPPAGGCCDPPPAPLAAPRRPTNLPGLSRIAYRIGSFTSFRRAMLDAVAQPELLGATPNPFARWHEGSDGDYHTMMIELWAYLADILSFYQELIANEVFLPTATQRDSLLRIAGLIGYRPGPGAAAAGQLAFTVAKGKAVSVPARFRAGSRAAPGKPAAVFETESPTIALGEHSAIPLSAVAPTNQFAPIATFGAVYGGLQFVQSELAGLFAALYGSAGAIYAESYATALVAGTAASQASASSAAISAQPALEAGPAALSVAASPSALSVASSATLASSGLFAAAQGFVYLPFQDSETRTIVLKGTSTRLRVGDYVLSVENEQAAGERARVHQIDTVTADKAAGTTTITWQELASDPAYSQSQKPVALYALRVAAAPFGSNAPIWATLPQTLIGTVNGVDGPYKDRNWDDLSDDDAYVPARTTIILDSTYDDAKGTSANPGWAVLRADGEDDLVFHVTDARPVNFADYALNNKVTRLTLGSGEQVPSSTYPLRTTLVLTGGEPLELQNNLPLPAEVAGATLILAGQYPRLLAGQAVFLRGTVLDTSTGQPSATVAAEPGVLAEPPGVDAVNNVTTVKLQQALSRSYVRDGAVLMANVVTATQGETVRDELLGSGNGGPFQSFALKQKPLTYLPASDPEGLAAVASTLLVTVNGVSWEELPTVLESPPDAQVYTAAQDEAGATTLLFGDGVNGARPPSGRDNIRARYRKGIGVSGNVDSGGISQLIDNLPGLQQVTNPTPSIGGADAESAEQIRSNAPGALRTFGRAVSVDDYGALARAYPGVAKASASWVLRDPATLQAIIHPYVQLTVALADGTPLAEQPEFAGRLRSFIDKRRDPNVPLRIIDFTPVFVDLVATVQIDARYPHQATLNAAYAALRPGPSAAGAPGFFAFESLDFGESLHLSAVYAALQAVPGVQAATITTFRRTSDLPGTVLDDIFIRPTEVAVLADDPEDTANQRGKLLLIGEGGFVDT